jgi:hypothetical protein
LSNALVRNKQIEADAEELIYLLELTFKLGYPPSYLVTILYPRVVAGFSSLKPKIYGNIRHTNCDDSDSILKVQTFTICSVSCKILDNSYAFVISKSLTIKIDISYFL